MYWDDKDTSGCPSWGSRSSDYVSSRQSSDADMWSRRQYEEEDTTISGGSYHEGWGYDQGGWTTRTNGGDKTTMYCTPRTLSAVESITSLWNTNESSVALTQRRNIWSTSYRGESFDFVEPDTSNYHTGAGLRSGYVPPAPSLMEAGSASPYSINTETSLSALSSSSSPSPSLFKSKISFRNLHGKPFYIPDNSRFFVIKSYNAIDVNSSFHHGVWTSTDLGNRRLDQAYQETAKKGGRIFLLFSVNSSGKFCGVAEMKNRIDFTKTKNIWVEKSRWKGIFPLTWHMVKDVPNRSFSSLRVPANENKPVTNSRDTQEIPYDVGISMLKIFSAYKCSTTFLQLSST